ncbi:MAG: hypothetical protein M1347_05860 [Chloroflexi bacterium]|nr:hypothetical protein [Chloroflexota bacterium]
MALNGKGIYLWQIQRVASGDPAAIANMAAAANLTHVLIKVADGKYGYGFSNGTDLVPGVVAALRAKGIQAWGWQYVYGADHKAEAQKAIDRIKMLKLDGFVVNAEGQFKAKSMADIASKYMKLLRAGVGNFPIGLSTYRYPTVHYQFPYGVFLEYCDYNLPQIYWIESVNPAQQLKKSYDEYKAIKPWRPFIPTGAAFAQGNWTVTPAQINEFLAKARAMQLPGANFWEMGAANDNGAQLWNAIRSYDWATGTAPTPEPGPEPQPVPTPTPPPATKPDILNRYLAALNSQNANKPTLLYEKNTSKLFAGNKKYKGRTEIYAFYNKLFKNVMPKATFSYRTWSWKGNVYKVNWKAISGSRSWMGADTIIMSTTNPNLIDQHYTAIPKSKSIDPDDESIFSEAGPIPV